MFAYSFLSLFFSILWRRAKNRFRSLFPYFLLTLLALVFCRKRLTISTFPRLQWFWGKSRSSRCERLWFNGTYRVWQRFYWFSTRETPDSTLSLCLKILCSNKVTNLTSTARVETSTNNVFSGARTSQRHITFSIVFVPYPFHVNRSGDNRRQSVSPVFLLVFFYPTFDWS